MVRERQRRWERSAAEARGRRRQREAQAAEEQATRERAAREAAARVERDAQCMMLTQHLREASAARRIQRGWR